jgi:4a-hydroxytetrahydrobiopterin dehydratase
MNKLDQRNITSPDHDAKPLKGEQLEKLHLDLGNGWSVVDEHHLEKEYIFKDFRESLNFTNEVGELAESLDHHPDIHLSWGKVKVIIWSHKVGGLTENDFVFAAKVDVLPR